MSNSYADGDLVDLVKAAHSGSFNAAVTSEDETVNKTKQKASVDGVSTYADAKTGFQAVQKSTPTSLSIGIAGTNEVKDATGSWGNFGKGQAQGPEYEKMKEAIKDALAAGKSVKIGGFSMGGMVSERAAYDAVKEMEEGGIPVRGEVEVQTYNSPGMKGRLGADEDEEVRHGQHIKTNNFQVTGDQVSMVGTPTGEVVKLDPVYTTPEDDPYPVEDYGESALVGPTPKFPHSLDTFAEANEKEKKKARKALAVTDDAGLIGKPPARKDDLSLPEKIEAKRARERLERAVKAGRAQKEIDARRAKNDAAAVKAKARFDKKLGIVATDDAGLIGKPSTRLRAKKEDPYAFEGRRARRSLLGGADEPLGGTAPRRGGLLSEPTTSEAAQSSPRSRRGGNGDGSDRFGLGDHGGRFEKAEKAIARAQKMETFGWTWEGDDEDDTDTNGTASANASTADAAERSYDSPYDKENGDDFDPSGRWHQGGLVTDRDVATDDPALAVTLQEGEVAIAPKTVEIIGAEVLAALNARAATGEGTVLKARLEDILGRGRPTGEAALRQLMKKPAYWNARHPDHARVRHRVGMGFRLLHPALPVSDGDPKTQDADVPARLPEGAFVLNSKAARALGTALLARLSALGQGWAGDKDAALRIRRAIGR